MSTIGRILKHLKNQGQTNTFRLARELDIDRHKILKIIEKLEKKQLIEFKSGTVKFLKFPERERKAKKPIRIKKAYSKPASVKHKIKRVMAKRKLSILKNLQAENKAFKERFLALEKTIKELQLKASSPPKIIRRTVVKNIIKKVPVEKIEAEPKKFKILKFNLSWIKNIQRLQMPEFLQRKINMAKPKINFAELNKDIQQLHVPEVLRKSI